MAATFASTIESMRAMIAETRAKLRAAQVGHPFSTAAKPILDKLDEASAGLAALDKLTADAELATLQAAVARVAESMRAIATLVRVAAVAAQATMTPGAPHGPAARQD